MPQEVATPCLNCSDAFVPASISYGSSALDLTVCLYSKPSLPLAIASSVKFMSDSPAADINTESNASRETAPLAVMFKSIVTAGSDSSSSQEPELLDHWPRTGLAPDTRSSPTSRRQRGGMCRPRHTQLGRTCAQWTRWPRLYRASYIYSYWLCMLPYYSQQQHCTTSTAVQL